MTLQSRGTRDREMRGGTDAMRVCLFGCGGFIGSHLAEWLLERPNVEVVGTDVQHGKIVHLLDEPRFTFYDSDLRHDRALTQRLIETSDVVVDLVAVTKPGPDLADPLHVFRMDFLENLGVAEICAESRTRLVQLSSCEVYGTSWLSLIPEHLLDVATREAQDVLMHEDDTPLIAGPVGMPRWIYAVSKHMLERTLHAAGESRGLDYSIIRPFNFVGPRFDGLPAEMGEDSPPLFAQFMDGLIDGTRMALVEGGQAQRTFIYIEDAIECIGRIVTDTSGLTSRQIFNVGNPANEITIEGLARMMYDRYMERHWDRVSPLPVIENVRAEEFLGDGYQHADRFVPDIEKARRLLGWEPKWGLQDLVTATMDAYVAEHPREAEAVTTAP